MSKKTYKKIAIVASVIGLVAMFKIFHLDQYLTLSYIKESQQSFLALYTEHQAVVIAGYMTVYILVTALSLPGAAILTIAGGALFGLLAGARLLFLLRALLVLP